MVITLLDSVGERSPQELKSLLEQKNHKDLNAMAVAELKNGSLAKFLKSRLSEVIALLAGNAPERATQGRSTTFAGCIRLFHSCEDPRQREPRPWLEPKPRSRRF